MMELTPILPSFFLNSDVYEIEVMFPPKLTINIRNSYITGSFVNEKIEVKNETGKKSFTTMKPPGKWNLYAAQTGGVGSHSFQGEGAASWEATMKIGE
jgi:hypothetical protein